MMSRSTMARCLVVLLMALTTVDASLDGLHYPLKDATPQLQQHQRELQDTNNSEETGIRVLVDHFNVELERTPFQLEAADINQLHGILEQVVFEFLSSDASMPMVDDVLLGDIHSSKTDLTTTLFLQPGIVNFAIENEAAAPTTAALNNAVQTAVDGFMVESLQGTPYYYIQSAKYIDLVDDDGIDGVVVEPKPASSGGLSPGAVAGLILGLAALAMLLVGLIIGRRRRMDHRQYIEQRNSTDLSKYDLSSHGSKEMEDEATVNLSQETPDIPPPSPQSLLDDGRLSVGSESDFTVNTEAGDSAMLKSLSGTGRAARPMVEVFARDRAPALRKDMLTSTWSASRAFALGSLKAGNESVLEPSHFNAKQARRDLIFEQANEEATDVVMMPPSQTRGRTPEIV